MEPPKPETMKPGKRYELTWFCGTQFQFEFIGMEGQFLLFDRPRIKAIYPATIENILKPGTHWRRSMNKPVRTKLFWRTRIMMSDYHWNWETFSIAKKVYLLGQYQLLWSPLAIPTSEYKAGRKAGLAGEWQSANPFSTEATFTGDYRWSWGVSAHPKWVLWYRGWLSGHGQRFDELHGDRLGSKGGDR
jgi:hypothetical protein